LERVHWEDVEFGGKEEMAIEKVGCVGKESTEDFPVDASPLVDIKGLNISIWEGRVVKKKKGRKRKEKERKLN